MRLTSARLRAAYVTLAAADAWLAGTEGRWAQRARLVSKPLLMPVLAGSLLASHTATGHALRTTLAGEAFGWGGDVALLRHGTVPFAVGTGSFGIGHVAYVAGFVRRRDPGTPLLRRPATRALGLVWLVSAPVMAVGASRTDPVLGPAVAAYSALLTAMAATALHVDAPPASRRLTGAGALLFLASDTLLGARKFLMPDPPERLESVVMATYTAAQLLLAEGAARAS